MKLKVGDKVVCKRSLYKHNNFTINEKYYICGTSGKNVYVTDNNGVAIYFTIISNFTEDGNFYKYFYTDKEIRKLKLEKINGKA